MKKDKNKGLQKSGKNELERGATIKKSLIVQADGNRHPWREAEEM